ncbi:MAG: Gfo/Idh/MocA family oxidoreductase [Ignavibacteria bacterium]|nr:Gfo/Idh/MocA family oxidoreductase [Ignavibacteria bacterium]MCC7160014.1 Gfo/Idh/MocA family oxidoreductase [Ignavibacteria bacterium]
MLKIGLAGCGHLGKIHCRLLNELSVNNPAYKFAGIYDTDKNNSDEVNKLYGLPQYNSFEDLLNKIDTLIIVTPTTTHFSIAKKAIKRNINVFIEKPVTSSLEEAQDLIQLAETNPVKIQVGHVERFNPALTSLAGFDLKPMFIESHRLAQFNPRGTDVSVIQDLMIHDIDIILHLVSSPITKIDANGVAVISDAIDIANARLTFRNGCVANLTSSRISLKKMRKMRIFQNNAYISIDFLNNKSEIFRLTDIDTMAEGLSFPLSDSKKIIFEQPNTGSDSPEKPNPIKNELESFFESILGNKPVKVSLEDGKEAVEAADEIIRIISGHQN